MFIDLFLVTAVLPAVRERREKGQLCHGVGVLVLCNVSVDYKFLWTVLADRSLASESLVPRVSWASRFVGHKNARKMLAVLRALIRFFFPIKLPIRLSRTKAKPTPHTRCFHTFAVCRYASMNARLHLPTSFSNARSKTGIVARPA